MKHALCTLPGNRHLPEYALAWPSQDGREAAPFGGCYWRDPLPHYTPKRSHLPQPCRHRAAPEPTLRAWKSWHCSIVRFFRFFCRLPTLDHGGFTGIFRKALAEGHRQRSMSVFDSAFKPPIEAWRSGLPFCLCNAFGVGTWRGARTQGAPRLRKNCGGPTLGFGMQPLGCPPAKKNDRESAGRTIVIPIAASTNRVNHFSD